MPQIGLTVLAKGPLFFLQDGPVVDALSNAIEDLVEEGERDVTSQLYPGHGLDTGHYRRSINGEITDSLNGRIHDSGVVYGPWLEGTSSRNRSSRFKGYAMFRNAFQRLEQRAEPIFRLHLTDAVRKLGGR